jgi:hypothetical protein
LLLSKPTRHVFEAGAGTAWNPLAVHIAPELVHTGRLMPLKA